MEQRTGGRLARMTAAFGEGIGLALARFPAASFAIVIFAAISSLVVEDIEPFGPENTFRLLAAFSAASAAALGAALLGESLDRPKAVRVLASFFAAAVSGVLVWFGNRIGVFSPALTAALFLAVPLAPHLVHSNPRRFWTFIHWGTFGAALAFVSVLLFVAGVSAILEMVRYLFGVGLSSRAYEHIYVVAATLIGPLFALGRVPSDLGEEVDLAAARDDRVTSGLRILQDWIATPLALVMALVLHAYAAKILATGELPRNQIGWITGGFALFVLCVRVVADPFIAERGMATRLFGRVWAFALVVPTGLLVYALFLRIAGAGVTVERYYLGVAALSATLAVLAQGLPRLRGDIRVMAVIPVLLLALSSVGPWGVSASVGRSQIARLLAEVPSEEGVLRFAGLDEEKRDSARSRVQAMGDAEALARLLPLLSATDRADLSAMDETTLESTLLARFGLAYGTPPSRYRTFAAGRIVPFEVGGFDTVFWHLTAAGADTAVLPVVEAVPAFTVESMKVAIRYRDVIDRFDTPAVLRDLPDTSGTSIDEVAPLAVEVRTSGGRTLRLFMRSATFDARTFDDPDLVFDLALRRNEWTAPSSLGGDGNR